MKISYKHLENYFDQTPSIDEISSKLFQLGHEHEILENRIFDIEFTPNRGDCLSLYGLCRDLKVFYNINFKKPSCIQELPALDLKFKNNTVNDKTNITFLNIKIKKKNVIKYKNYLENYFSELSVKKNNFFTDISNFVAYEIGQPTHCYDISNLNLEEDIILENARHNEGKFITLFNEEVDIHESDLVFKNNNEVINLAGIVGGKNTSCSTNTENVLVECAYFNPESIIGRSQKYNIQSDAAYKFERGVDPLSHDFALSRFIEIVRDHVEIENISIFTEKNQEQRNLKLEFNVKKINKILGINFFEDEYKRILTRLGFEVGNEILVPSFRNDIFHQNDLAEEVARVIGYNNISTQKLSISEFSKNIEEEGSDENKIKHFLIKHGFNEVINNPFTNAHNKLSISIDNPLDQNRRNLRINLINSLIENLQYNEKRQNDSIKIFEISDVYYLCENTNKILQNKKLAIIVSGRVGLNYEDFSKKLDKKYLINIFNSLGINIDESIIQIDRNKLNSKIKLPIYALEVPVKDITKKMKSYKHKLEPVTEFVEYKQISDFPSSTRDISFSVADNTKIPEIFDLLNNANNELLKHSYIFDYYQNKKTNETKIGFRATFQSKDKTLTDREVEDSLFKIINPILSIKSVSVPGLNKN
tara:strand:+ start:38298 stop:40238 length:1941 start_codon:yes stop_codon:yes gene_type:complete